MLAIKLKRIGKKKQATFRVIVAEKREKMRGLYAEDIGYWNPHINKYEIKGDRVNYWIEKGAQPTDSVHNLLIKAGIIKGIKKPVHHASKDQKNTEQIEETAKISTGETASTDTSINETLTESTPAEESKSESIENAETPTEAAEEKPAETT